MSIYLKGELTHFLQRINGAIDSGRYSTISIGDVEEHIFGGDLFPWLRTALETGDLDPLPEDFKATLTERKPEPTGVVMGPLMATFVDRTDSTTSSGSGAPPRSIATAPASWRSQTIGPPLAAITSCKRSIERSRWRRSPSRGQ